MDAFVATAFAALVAGAAVALRSALERHLPAMGEGCSA